MEQIIYADILFAVNFSMDFLALYITAFILKLKFSVKRCVFSAALGAIYGTASVYFDLGALVEGALTVLIGCLMCVTLNGYNGRKNLFREALIFFAVNLLIGGGMTAIYEYFNSHGGADSILIYGSQETVEQQLPLAVFVIASGFITVILLLFGRGISKHSKSERVMLEILHREKKISVQGMTDSGNLLTEPISGLPVIVLRSDVAHDIVDDATLKNLTEFSSNKSGITKEKIRFILYETLSGKGMIGAFMPDKITINGNTVGGWVAISDALSLNQLRYDQAIVPMGLVH